MARLGAAPGDSLSVGASACISRRAPPPGGIVLRLRHHAAAKLSGVTVGGAAWPGYNATAETIAFSAPYAEIQATFMVRPDRGLQRIADVDRDGVRVCEWFKKKKRWRRKRSLWRRLWMFLRASQALGRRLGRPPMPLCRGM